MEDVVPGPAGHRPGSIPGQGAWALSYAGPVSSEPVSPEATAVELMRAMTRLRARLRTEAPIDDLPWNWSHLTTLHRIVQDGPTTASELAQAEHVRRQSMAETLAALREGGLVTTAKDPDDGRKTLVSATRVGRVLCERIPAAREAWLSEAMRATLRAEERRTLHRAAEIMNRLADSDR
ncbi:DNA-binding MarR family transcriptional regulator [Kitasatospora sp. MAA19]|nr:DNA-binding MarR family transcriptional regulator [Kitasatospora sp. MAA19]